MKIHIIAIGGSAMHNLAIALKEKGYEITGSDDEIFEPSYSRLKKHGLLPEKPGWYPRKITSDIDAVILGMHATEDNPELLRARQLWLKIYSYPEYLYNQTIDKKRVVIAGSHGKTTITSMIMHVLKHCERDFDFMSGASIEGFDTMVHLSDTSTLAVFEGDEYLSSALDKRPKFHLYIPHIALISGIAWDHVNVFPDFDSYKRQFSEFIEHMEPSGTLYYYEGDPVLKNLVERSLNNIDIIPYNEHLHMIRDHYSYLLTQSGSYKFHLLGKHNLQNVEGARLICKQLEVSDVDFYKAISTFHGASKRLQAIHSTENSTVYMDFAHAPSKVKATIEALKTHYPERKLNVCLELHTYSSLNKNFIGEYHNTLASAAQAAIFYNPETVKHKRLEKISAKEIKKAFGRDDIEVITDTSELSGWVKKLKLPDSNLLFMSSGNFGGLDIKNTIVNNLRHLPS